MVQKSWASNKSTFTIPSLERERDYQNLEGEGRGEQEALRGANPQWRDLANPRLPCRDEAGA